MHATTLRWTCAAVFSAAAAGLASRTTVAAPVRAHGVLVLTSFVQRERTDVVRNEVLEFRFSTPLRRGSVDARTLQVSQVAPDGLHPAAGARIVTGHVVRFDPTRSQRNYDESLLPNTLSFEADRPEGFPGLADFVVRLPNDPNARSLRSRDGHRIAQTFSATFRTSTGCVDPVEGQPLFIGDHGTGLLGFDPPRHAATGLIDADAAVVLEFSEPILTESLRPGETVLVTRTRTGERIDGTVTPDPFATGGRRFLFVPTGGFGTDVDGHGWDVQVSLTTGITDLGGNSLKRAVGAAVFRTQ